MRYPATLLAADSETVLKWFILVVALLLDPAAVLLLLAAASADDEGMARRCLTSALESGTTT